MNVLDCLVTKLTTYRVLLKEWDWYFDLMYVECTYTQFFVLSVYLVFIIFESCFLSIPFVYISKNTRWNSFQISINFRDRRSSPIWEITIICWIDMACTKFLRIDSKSIFRSYRIRWSWISGCLVFCISNIYRINKSTPCSAI